MLLLHTACDCPGCRAAAAVALCKQLADVMTVLLLLMLVVQRLLLLFMLARAVAPSLLFFRIASLRCFSLGEKKITTKALAAFAASPLGCRRFQPTSD